MLLHHVQLSAPTGGEEEARRFWVDALGLVEVEKPAALRGRGGCWFRHLDGERVTAEIHVGVEEPFTPARKAHPALAVASVTALDALAANVRAMGFAVDERERDSFDGYVRFHTADPFGNRVEVLAPLA